MNPPKPGENPLIPAVQHLTDSLEADSAGVQRIADKLVASLDDSLVSDKNYLQKAVKSRLSRAVGNSIRRDQRRINDMAQPMRAAVATSLVSDQERVDQIAARLPTRPSTPAGAPFPGASYCNNLGVVDPPPHQDWVCYETDCPSSGPPPVIIPPNWAYALPNGHWAICGSVGSGAPPGDGDGVPTPPVPPPVPPPPDECPPCPPCPEPPPVPDGGTGAAPGAADVACAPLPAGMDGLRVYLVPWLEPGDRLPSVPSECGRKLVNDGLWDRYPASDLLVALQSGTATDEYLPDSVPGTYLLTGRE